MKSYSFVLGATLAQAQLLVPQSIDSCHGIKEEASCMQQDPCVWCKAWAIPSACLTLEEAKQVNSSVFECREKSNIPDDNLSDVSSDDIVQLADM